MGWGQDRTGKRSTKHEPTCQPQLRHQHVTDRLLSQADLPQDMNAAGPGCALNDCGALVWAIAALPLLPQLADFGLAHLLGEEQTHVQAASWGTVR